MSEENVELARRGHEAFRRSGEEAIFEYLHADVEMRPIEELPGADDYRGHDGFRLWFRTLREAFGEFTWEPQEFVDLGDHVLVETRFVAQGRGSSVPVEATIYNLWTVRHGKVSRVRGYLSRQEAVEAARLSD